MAATSAPTQPVSVQTHPRRYKHWQLSIDGDIATLRMNVQPHEGQREGYELKLNSYDIGVDVELNDAVQRLRFEHPQVRCVVLTGSLDRVFCAGANILMLRTSTHGFKVNFCKYTNETRLGIEDAGASPTRRALASRTRARPAASASSRRSTARPRAAATSSRWPATRSCSSTIATAR